MPSRANASLAAFIMIVMALCAGAAALARLYFPEIFLA